LFPLFNGNGCHPRDEAEGKADASSAESVRATSEFELAKGADNLYWNYIGAINGNSRRILFSVQVQESECIRDAGSKVSTRRASRLSKESSE